MFYQKQDFIDYLIDLIKECNKIILKVYETDFEKNYKNDNSPLTLADSLTNNFICQKLDLLNKKLELDILIISEEIKNKPYDERQNYNYCWLIDPLDGTKEFIKRNGQFTCNIGLVYNADPIFGIVSIPVTGEIFYGIKDVGSFKLLNNIKTTLMCNKEHDPIKIIVSNSHMNEDTKNFLKKYPIHEQINIGSSIKLLWIAENKADIYPRLGPTSEWDTCAAHAVVKYAGGKVLQYEKNIELQYNKENLLNPYFIAYFAR